MLLEHFTLIVGPELSNKLGNAFVNRTIALPLEFLVDTPG